MSDHIKRLAAPRSWPLKRKVNVWITKPSAGAHSIESSLPALVVLRDMLKLCDTAKEAKRIIGNREIIVDGKPLKSYKMPIGLMDVVSIPKMKTNYRMLITSKGKLTIEEISEKDAEWKLCRIENKTTIKGGKIQLNLHDGRNVLIDKDAYKTGDVLKLALKDQSIIESYPLDKGSYALISEGNHAGYAATISEYIVVGGVSKNLVKFTDGSETVKDNVFVIGNKTPVVKLPEAELI